MATAIVAGKLYELVWPLDEMDVAAHHRGDLRTLHSYADWPAEELDVAASITVGELRVLLHSYADWPAEEMDVAASLVSWARWP